jgi:hypothetical protein
VVTGEKLGGARDWRRSQNAKVLNETPCGGASSDSVQ